MKQSEIMNCYRNAKLGTSINLDGTQYTLEDWVKHHEPHIVKALAQYDPDSIVIKKSDVPEGLGEAVDSERSKSRNYIKPTEYALIYKTAALVANAMKESEG